MTKQMTFFRIKISGFEVIIQQICLSFLTDNILKWLDEVLLTGILLIDLQKALTL